LVFTIQHFTSKNFELFAVNGILLLPVIVSVIASAMNVFLDGKMLRKGSNSDE